MGMQLPNAFGNFQIQYWRPRKAPFTQPYNVCCWKGGFGQNGERRKQVAAYAYMS